jgi:hypothetical protein
VFVDSEDAEEAAALIAELRDASPAEGAEDEDEDGDEASLGGGGAPADVAVVVDRRKRMGATVLLALVITFGTGHLSTGAWRRGVALAAVEIVGMRYATAGNRWGVALIALAVFADLLGAVIRVRQRGAPAKLPTAMVMAKPRR